MLDICANFFEIVNVSSLPTSAGKKIIAIAIGKDNYSLTIVIDPANGGKIIILSTTMDLVGLLFSSITIGPADGLYVYYPSHCYGSSQPVGLYYFC